MNIDSTLSVSVIICAYTENRLEDLCRSIQSVLGELRDNDELVFVADYNQALTAAVAERFPDESRLMLVPNEQQKGLSGARNTGIDHARGDIVAFVDDDAAVEGGWLSALLESYANPVVKGVGGYAEPRWPTERPRWMPAEFDWVVGCSHRGLPETPTPVRNFIGCNMSFRREVFDKVGGFRVDMGRVDTLPVGCEETELCIRYRRAEPDSELLFNPSVRVRHRVSDDRVEVKYFLRRCFGEGFSKYKVSKLVGVGDGLAAERDYVRRVLPIAVLRGLLAFFSPTRGGHRAGISRAAMIVLGLGTTVLGYVYAAIPPRLRFRRS